MWRQLWDLDNIAFLFMETRIDLYTVWKGDMVIPADLLDQFREKDLELWEQITGLEVDWDA